MKLKVTPFALTCSLMWGFGLFFITWWIILFDGPTGDTTLIGRVYRGYSVSMTGGFIGLGWGLVDGLIGGAVFAWLYNTLASKVFERSAG